MNKQLRVGFAPGMPPAVVELFAPDLRPLGSFMLRGGAWSKVEAPPLKSFLRIHLPSGRVVTIPNAEQLDDREITPAMFERQRADAPHPTGAETKTVAPEVPSRRRGWSDEFVAAFYDPPHEEPITSLGTPAWKWQIAGAREPRGFFQWSFVNPVKEPRDLVGTFGSMTIRLRLPGSTTLVRILPDPDGSESEARRVVVGTTTAEADLTLSLLQAKMFAAKDMLAWAQSIRPDRIRDPYAAVVAGYLLLRLGHVDVLKTWSEALCEIAPDLPDAAVLQAWVALSGKNGQRDAARESLRLAVDRGIPVYTEGIRLLIDGLRIAQAEAELERFQNDLGMVLWTTPLTTCVSVSQRINRMPSISVGFETSL